MRVKEYKSLGLVVKVSVPSTADEFDQLAKRAGACVDEATNNAVYRGYLGEFRDTLLHGIEAEPAKDGKPAVPGFDGIEQRTKITRKVKKVKKGDKEVEVYDETEDEYLSRVAATQKVEVSSFQPIADEVCKRLAFDPSASERKPAGPKTLPAIYKNTAAGVIAKGKKSVDILLALFKRDINKTVVLTNDPAKDAELLGWAIKEHKAWKDKQDMEAYSNPTK